MAACACASAACGARLGVPGAPGHVGWGGGKSFFMIHEQVERLWFYVVS